MSENSVKTVLVCYTQAVFDNQAPLVSDASELEDDVEELNAPREFLVGTLEVSTIAEKLVLALRHAQVEAETIKVPLRSYAPRDLAKASFAWRLLDLSESNGRHIDSVICLDFPAWSISHSNKICWTLSLPFFSSRQQVQVPFLRPTSPAGNGSNQPPEEAAVTVSAMLQAERRGLAEARRIYAAQRPVAEELARGGIQIEFNPVPSMEVEPTGAEWEKVVRRFLV